MKNSYLMAALVAAVLFGSASAQAIPTNLNDGNSITGNEGVNYVSGISFSSNDNSNGNGNGNGGNGGDDFFKGLKDDNGGNGGNGHNGNDDKCDDGKCGHGVSGVPLPASLPMFAMGLVGLFLFAASKKARKNSQSI